MANVILMFVMEGLSTVSFAVGAIMWLVGFLFLLRIFKHKSGQYVWSLNKDGYILKKWHMPFAVIMIVAGTLLTVLSFTLFPALTRHFFMQAGTDYIEGV